MDLRATLNNVNSKETFLEFVHALAADRFEEEELEKLSPSSPWGPGAKGWEHGTIGAYLDAVARCASANAKKRSEDVSWKAFAEMLHAGKFYE